MENDPIYDEALRDLERHQAECRRLEDFLDRYKGYRRRATAAQQPEITDAPKSEAPRKGAPANNVISVVHDILAKRQDALTLSAIFTALCDRGVVIGGNNPKQNLSQKLSTCPDLKSYGKRGWYFADEIPPCMHPVQRLSDDDPEYDEDPVTEVTRPSQSNGAASSN